MGECLNGFEQYNNCTIPVYGSQKPCSHHTEWGWHVFWELCPSFSPLTNKDVHTLVHRRALTEIEFSMPWMVCVCVLGSGLWTCILLYVNEAGRHRRALWCSLDLILPRPPLLCIVGSDEVIHNTQYIHTLNWSKVREKEGNRAAEPEVMSVLFLALLFLVKNLVPTLPKMQLDPWQFIEWFGSQAEMRSRIQRSSKLTSV